MVQCITYLALLDTRYSQHRMCGRAAPIQKQSTNSDSCFYRFCMSTDSIQMDTNLRFRCLYRSLYFHHFSIYTSFTRLYTHQLQNHRCTCYSIRNGMKSASWFFGCESGRFRCSRFLPKRDPMYLNPHISNAFVANGK